MAPLEKLGRSIANLRRKRGLTQEDLAGLTRMDRAFISEIENGRTSLSVESLLRIAKALGLRASEVLATIER